MGTFMGPYGIIQISNCVVLTWFFEAMQFQHRWINNTKNFRYQYKEI